MTQEEKQLVIKDLSARLPYGVMVLVKGEKYFNETNEPYIVTLSFGTYLFDDEDITLVPYLRPMSSMTDKEKDELYTAMDWYGEIDESGNVYTKGQEKVYRETFYEYTDWLISHHFDYRGLIEKGLALEAPKDMYIF